MDVKYSYISRPWHIVIAITLCLLCIISVLANITVIVTVVGSRKFRSINSIFLLNMSICDMGLSLTLVPMAANGILQEKWNHEQISCQVIGILINVFSVGSISTITALALDRYLSIIHCLKYSSWSSWKYIVITLVVIWTEAVVSSAPAISGDWGIVVYEKGYHICLITWKYHLSYSVFMAVIMFVFPLTVMLFCYGSIIKVARLHARKIGDINDRVIRNSSSNTQISSHGYVAYAMIDPINRVTMLGLPNAQHVPNFDVEDFDFRTDGSVHSGSAAPSHRLRRQCKTVFRLLGLMMAFVLCWIFHVYKEFKEAIYLETNRDSVLNEYMSLFSVILIALHSTWNPFFYAILNKNFKSEIVAAFSHVFGKKQPLTNARDLLQSKIVSTVSRRYNRLNCNLHTLTDENISEIPQSVRFDFTNASRSVQSDRQNIKENHRSALVKSYLKIPEYVKNEGPFNVFSTYP